MLSVATLIAGAAAEEMLPNWCGTGFPVLLALTVLNAMRTSLPVAVIYAAAAAGFEDSLSALPFLTSVFFFLGATATARWTRLGWLTMLVVYPAYQIWLAAWIPAPAGETIIRFFVSIPWGMVTALLTGAVFLGLERKAAVE